MSAAKEVCPHCKASMQGEPIPSEYLEHKPDCETRKALSILGRCYCLPYGEGTTHFSRVIGHEVRGVYDGVLFWSCPDCGKAWPRFTDGRGRLTAISAEYAVDHNLLKETPC